MTIDCAQALASPLMQQIIRVESGGNPYAIGVVGNAPQASASPVMKQFFHDTSTTKIYTLRIVGNALQRQPRNAAEAIATARMLQSRGLNYSIGIGQVNKIHFARLGWDTDLQSGFDDCHNVLAAADILTDCRARAVRAGYSVETDITTTDGIKASASDAAALSCYYSGDLRAGTKLGYTAKVLRGYVGTDSRTKSGKPAVNEILMMAD